jgi:aspartate dehydrogenase
LRPSRIGIIGFGAITQEMIRGLEARDALGLVSGVLERSQNLSDHRIKAAGRFSVVGSLDELLASKPDVVVEAAGHSAAQQFGGEVLRRGHDLLLASVGVLAFPEISQALAAAALASEIWIAAGAVAGIDGLLAARTAGLRRVTYTSIKPPDAWKGTAGERAVEAFSGPQRRELFVGSAREAGQQFPQNANVAVTIALAGLGLDRTRVVLVADPSVPGPLGLIEAEGEFGRFSFEILALASKLNNKTSAITGHSLVAAILDGMCFGVRDLLNGADAVDRDQSSPWGLTGNSLALLRSGIRDIKHEA